MRIGEVAALLGVSPDFIRDLERRGAVPPLPRDLNGHRRLTEDDVAQLRGVIYGSGARLRDSTEGRAKIDAEVARLREWAERNGLPWTPRDPNGDPRN